MTPYFDNGSITLFHNKAEHVIPNLQAGSFGCVLLDPPVSMRRIEECDYLIDVLGIVRLLRCGGIAYTLANPGDGIFVTVKGPHGERSNTIASPLRKCGPVAAHGHPHVRPATAIKGLVMSTTGLILDPYCGIGTTLEMAQELRREAIGIEIEEKYCRTAVTLLAA